MGSIVKFSSIYNKEKKDFEKMLFPVFFCWEEKELSKYIKGYEIVDLNFELAQNLLKYDNPERIIHLENEVKKIVNKKSKLVIVKNFDILFNPEWSIDVVKIFINLNRINKIVVIWPGECRDNKLIYSEPGYMDYKTFEIENYEITCLI